MQLGKSLVGAIIGGALGIGVLLLVQKYHGWDGYWMALPVALLTGLGVRLVANVKGHPSYLRGAMTGILSIGLFILGQYVVAQVTTRGAAAKGVPTHEPVLRQATLDAAAEEPDAAADETTATAPAQVEGNTPATADEPPVGDEQPAADEEAEPAQNDRSQPAAGQQNAEAEGTGGAAVSARTPLAKQWTTIDLVWLCIAALVGYSLGRGSEPALPSSGEPQDDVAPNRSMPPSD